MKFTITRKRHLPNQTGVFGCTYTLNIDKLPNQTFGPYDYTSIYNELLIHNLRSVAARNIIFDAYMRGHATAHPY